MDITTLNPRQALNRAFLRAKPNRIDIDLFKSNLIQLLERTNDTESEEFHKILLADFLKKTYYEPNHFINPKGRNDLVIHNGKNADSTVGVILETKKPTNTSEMPTTHNLNCKAFQELLLYYLRERISLKNLEVKHLIVTNIYEWFVFDVSVFERLFAQNKTLVSQFEDFEERRLADIKTSFFYQEIAEAFIAELKIEIEFTYFNLQDYKNILSGTDKADDKQLIALFKLLSPEHLLKLPFANDSNTLDKRFYTELLHILGLTEIKSGSKKLIERNKEGERNSGSLLEDAIIQLDSLDKISRLNKPHLFGNNPQERFFNVALELCITWINRILFLKLLEAQLMGYHKGDKAYAFLSLEKLKNYNDLNGLFFQVLAKNYDDRNSDVKQFFANVPYLNSSLFEPTELEQVTLFISNLQVSKTLPIFSQTVLKDSHGKKLFGQLNTFEYLLRFLDAYDFGSEGEEDIQEDNKPLINASVLGLIFEKINGYKDGSFFTPGFITMYMSRETLRKSVVQKFKDYCLQQNFQNEVINSIADIYELIPHKISKIKANEIINSLKICDPAVGSGHFLVSVLNEIIAIKSELMILLDKNGKSLHRYKITAENDELVVAHEEGGFFKYFHPNNEENQRVQEGLFHEKQTLIENCLFGVDINPNSVKICRLRLWIELLKNAYYTPESKFTELETLPNIDINIKCGNSLVSRFAIDADLGQALKKNKWTIESYRVAVDTYRNAVNREQKREMEKLIADIKSDFSTEISANDPKLRRLRGLEAELFQMQNQIQLFEMTKKEKADWDKKLHQLAEDIKKLEVEIEEIKTGKIFENAFEWRFEFPEVLNDNGDFMGFDVVIGNPPYVPSNKIESLEKQYYESLYRTSEYQINTYGLFIELGMGLVKDKRNLCFIIPNYWLSTKNDSLLRNFLFLQNYTLEISNVYSVFESAVVDTLILICEKSEPNGRNTLVQSVDSKIKNISDRLKCVHNKSWDITKKVVISELNFNAQVFQKNKITERNFDYRLSELCSLKFGLKLYQTGKGNPPQTKEIAKSKKFEASNKIDNSYLPMLRARDVQKYQILKPEIFINYGDHLAEPRNLEIFKGERILLQRIIGKNNLCAAFTAEEITCNSDIITIFPLTDKVALKFILGIICSKLCLFILKSNNINLDRAAFPKINTKTLSDFPVVINDTLEKKIVKLVDKLLDRKSIDPQANTSNLENQIDQLVYQLYDLTEAEIEIIENA